MCSQIRSRVRGHLRALYPDLDPDVLPGLDPELHPGVDELVDQVIAAVGIDLAQLDAAPTSAGTSSDGDEPKRRWGAEDTILITYADSVVDGDRAPLSVLREVVTRHLGDAISTVHVLPFSPSSSDRGFSVVDYTTVDPDFGTWEDLENLAADNDLMVDLVCNHASVASAWFQQFLNDEEPGCGFFVTVPSEADTSAVVRPRSLPLLHRAETAAGERNVWCTFSPDQADLDYSNPRLLIEMLRIIDLYINHGARFIRLDAVAYLWKELGTSCIHLPQTHEMIRLWRTLLECRAPHVALITETNVPSDQNLSYFGDGDEAHLIYNFSLPPLVIDALRSGHAGRIANWMTTMSNAPEGCSYLNFLTSHDGIGLRPAEELLQPDDVAAMVDLTLARGGRCSTYNSPEGPRPYELNISLWDLLSETGHSDEDALVEHRFVCAHAIMLGLAGIPAIYINTLFARPSDIEGVRASGVPRDMTRDQMLLEEVDHLFMNASTPRGAAVAKLVHLLRVRKRQPAFHPEAHQATLDTGSAILAFSRRSLDPLQHVVAVHNITARPQTVTDAELQLEPGQPLQDLVKGAELDAGSHTLAPYQTMWITGPHAGS